VRMLLNHTSGIGNYTNVMLQTYEDLITVSSTTYRPLDLAQLGLSMPPTGAPGELWSYSNTGYIILGLLIERLTGKRYAAEVQRRILHPLGLHRTYFPGTDARIRGPHSKAYVPWPDGTLRDFSECNMSWGWAAGEMISTAEELTRFYHALLGGRLLRPNLLEQMRQTVPIVPELPDLAGYGLGIYWQAVPNGQAWGHDGGVIGQTTISWHNTTSLSFGMNMTFYDAPAIDEALGNFLFGVFAADDPAAVSPLGRPIQQVSPLGRPIQQVHHLTDLRSPLGAR
jgi:D-alanyl-D-alanine carboxypeptidase